MLQEEWMFSGKVKVLVLRGVFTYIKTLVKTVKMSIQVIYGSFSPLFCILQETQLIPRLCYKSLGINLRSRFIPHIFLHLILILEVKFRSSDLGCLKGRHLGLWKSRERNGKTT